MPDISPELLGLLNYLLPGVVAAWVFHGLTQHPRRSPFGQVVLFLVFTAVVHALASLVWDGGLAGADGGGAAMLSASLAVLVGAGFAVASNKDFPHGVLRKWQLTTRTGYPSEWVGVFCQENRPVVLHLRDGRRLWGIPVFWPDSIRVGHFALTHCAWLKPDGERLRMPLVHRFLIHAKEVHWVEFELVATESMPKADEIAAAHAQYSHKEAHSHV